MVLVEGNYRGQSCVHLSVLLVVPLPETQIWNRIWASLSSKTKFVLAFYAWHYPILFCDWQAPTPQTQQGRTNTANRVFLHLLIVKKAFLCVFVEECVLTLIGKTTPQVQICTFWACVSSYLHKCVCTRVCVATVCACVSIIAPSPSASPGSWQLDNSFLLFQSRAPERTNMIINHYSNRKVTSGAQDSKRAW